MDRDELIKRLNGYEWSDIEFKSAQRDVPKSAYKTVSAFSNTEGGWLVFGVRDGVDGFEIVGVLNVDKVQNDFLTVLRSGEKLNCAVAANEQLFEDSGNVLLVFHIPEAHRQEKPVYLNGDIRQSFIRRGASDEQCTQAEIERLLRDASDERYDGGILEIDPERCFEDSSVRWYRTLFDLRNPGQDPTLSNLQFLHNWGLVVEVDGRLRPTRASILLFGTAAAFNQILPRPVVDMLWSRSEWSVEVADERWTDRLVIETNLIESWKTLVERYHQRAEKPFHIEPDTLQRDDHPPDYIVFREAAINLLIHQDFADHTRKPVIRFHSDRTMFWNPGDAFVSKEELLLPGEREVRNPRIVGSFRRIGISEQAGTGIRAIFGEWRQLGHVPPTIVNDRTKKSFQLTLQNEDLLTEEQILFQANLGVRLGEIDAKAFAFACREGELRPSDVHAVTGLYGPEGQAVLQRLTVQGLITPAGDGSSVFHVVEILREQLDRADLLGNRIGASKKELTTAQEGTRPTDLSTAQAHKNLGSLSTAQAALSTGVSATQRKILKICDTPRRLAEIMEALQVTNRGHLKKRHLDPLLQGGVLRMVHPEQPNHPQQAYVLTDAGVELKARNLSRNNGATNGDLTNET